MNTEHEALNAVFGDIPQTIHPNPGYFGGDEFLTPKIHMNTTNLSAIKCYKLLRDLGVKNNKFMLTIYDEALMYINPFSENLSPEMQHRVHAEIVRNYWYFLREIVRINVPGGTTHFGFQRGNLAISWLLLNNINTYLELPRQMTKTGTIAAYMAYNFGFRSINAKASMLSKDPESVKDNLSNIKNLLKNLPPYLQMLDEKVDRINAEYIKSMTTGNTIQTRNPPGNEQVAINKGRGSSEPVQWYDEMPFIRFIPTIVLNSAPSWATAANFAKENGAPFCRVFSSTPGILGTLEGDFVYDTFLPQCCRFDERLFYDQPSAQAVQEHVTKESKNDFVYVKFNYKQLGKGQDYFEKQCRYLQNDRDAIEREVLLKWSRRAMDSPFTKEQLDRASKSVKTPIGSITIQGRYVLKFFKKPDFNKRYVMSVDCSGMLDTDYSSLTVTDPQTFEPIATLRSNARDNLSNTRSFSRAIEEIALKVFKNALIVIEKNNMGIAIIDSILDDCPELCNRMYSSELEPNSQGKNNDYISGATNSDANVLRYDNKVIVYGFNTTQPRRAQMFSEILGVVINELYDCINDEDIFAELNGIVRKNGRLDHKNGKHDDMLFSWLIGLWVLCYSKILTTKYDFPIGYVRPMSIVDHSDEVLTERDFETKNDTIEKIGNMVVNSFQQQNMFTTPQVQVKPFDDSIITPDNQRFRGEDNYNFNNSSIAEIGEVIFGDTESLLGDDNYSMEDTPYIDTESPVEDMMHYANSLNKVDKEAFLRDQRTKMDNEIMEAKTYRQKNIEKARNAKERKRLERILENNREEISSGNIDVLIDNFFGN